MKIQTFFLSSGLPFLTVAITISPEPAAGSRLRRPLIPCTAITYKFLAPDHETRLVRAHFALKHDYNGTNSPVLSAQLMTAPTGRPREMRNLAPAAPPRPVSHQNIQIIKCQLSQSISYFSQVPFY